MTTAQDPAGTGAANRTGLYLAALQLVFTLGWTTYVVYLPRLAAEVGIAPSAVILILMLDQAIFTIADTAMGIAADKLAPHVGKLGLFVGLMAAISCGAFVALPFVAGAGAVAQGWFIALIVIDQITISAMNQPCATAPSRRCPSWRRWPCSATASPARSRPIWAWCCASTMRVCHS